jgi:sulfur-oxidizing protein SoxY
MLIALYSLVFVTSSKADVNPNLWPYIQERMFNDVNAKEVDFININGPKRAASGAQVPITIKLVETDGVYIEKIYLIIDANPTQHAATYILTDKTQNLNLLTRIRMETDSYVRAVGQDSSGNLYMSKVAIRASGGCSGYMDVNNPDLIKDVGKVLVKYKDNFITVRVKHPNFTGLQKDQESGGYIPKWIVEDIYFNINKERILGIKNDISMSQNPYVKFKYIIKDKDNIKVTVIDSKNNQLN